MSNKNKANMIVKISDVSAGVLPPVLKQKGAPPPPPKTPPKKDK